MLHHCDASCRCLFYHTCAFFALSVVLRSGIKLGWLIYLVVHPNHVMSSRLVNTHSAWYNNCKCCIDSCLTFPALSCTSKALPEIFLQILKLGLYFKSKSVFGGMVSYQNHVSYLEICFVRFSNWGWAFVSCYIQV